MNMTAIKDGVTALRDFILIVLLIALLFMPGTMKDILVAAGFTRGSFAGLEWAPQLRAAAEQTKQLGQAVSTAQADYDELLAQILELQPKTNDPSLKQMLSNLATNAENSRAELATADQAAKRTLSVQQTIVQQVAPEIAASSGWLYLGRVSADKQNWVAGSPLTVRELSLQAARGTVLTIRDDTYLRADSAGNFHSSAPILSVLHVGERVELDSLDYSAARGGGWFVWAKVRLAS